MFIFHKNEISSKYQKLTFFTFSILLIYTSYKNKKYILLNYIQYHILKYILESLYISIRENENFCRKWKFSIF